MRRLAVSTNWPTVMPKPERKALYGLKTRISFEDFEKEEREIERKEKLGVRN